MCMGMGLGQGEVMERVGRRIVLQAAVIGKGCVGHIDR